MSFNRRTFIRSASLAAAGNLAGLRPFGALNSAAATLPGYKALVCIFLYGGNDANNMIVPLETTANGTNGYANYAKVRGPLALPLSGLEKNTLGYHAGGNYGLHPRLADLAALFNRGHVAAIANVGTLMAKLTPAQFRAGVLPQPSNLFSHPDQQLEWQNSYQNSGSSTGWAGRIADAWGSSYGTNAKIPLVTSLDGDTLFCNGQATSPVSVNPGNVGTASCSEGAVCATRAAAAQALSSYASGFSLVQADNNITNNAYKYMKVLGEAVQSVSPLTVSFPIDNPLALQLQQIAQIIQVRAALGVNRQIFFAGLGNFDTHAAQLGTQATLLTYLSQAMNSFYAATEELGLADNVTTFTMSDFSRAFEPNSNAGSDHAWGGHHFIMGGAVDGGRIYGTFPTLELGGPNDADTTGRWVPTTPSVSYAATLASWFGVAPASINTIFPTLKNFPSAAANLGFMG